MALPLPALLLSGFVLAHAVWNVSDLPKGELFCPLAIVEQAGVRKLERFEASSQAEAITHGKEAMSLATKTADAWAFARDGMIRLQDGTKINVISVDFWAKGMERPASLIQRYEPFVENGGFKLIGDPEIVLDGNVLTPDLAKEIIQVLNQGIASHSKVSSQWARWHKE